jgi:hypothetical protein
MVGALFGARGQVTLHHGGGGYPPSGFPAKVKLFKHIHNSTGYNRFDTKPLTDKYQLVLH